RKLRRPFLLYVRANPYAEWYAPRRRFFDGQRPRKSFRTLGGAETRKSSRMGAIVIGPAL
ncbi:MAG: hypothetical protein LBR53_09745, partial [Deltaproteobacteria bacterium]|nr:hypothetical protein [Deltaproteobacteria bacterium]